MEHILFEFGDGVEIDGALELKRYLHRQWEEREILRSNNEEFDEFESTLPQPFLSFDGSVIRARNYVGFIQQDDLHLEIYPKVFGGVKAPDRQLMLRHIFFWLDHCSKWKFPFTHSDLAPNNLDFPELIIFLMATSLLETVSSSPLSLYESIEETLYVPKGKINFNRYIRNSLASGMPHRLECDYEPFVFDNKMNRGIKYCGRLLLSRARTTESVKILKELLFVLDEVSDEYCTQADLDRIRLNSFFTTYDQTIGICRMVLQQQLYSGDRDALSQWSLLLRMEYVFEDFLAGFIQKYFSNDWSIVSQASDMKLTSFPPAFLMRHDIFMQSRHTGRNIIIDAKYKLRPSLSQRDAKQGISQQDLYQVVSYALRRGCTEVILLYPNVAEDTWGDSSSFLVESGFAGKEQIRITATEVPLWSLTNFESLDGLLKKHLEELLKSKH